MGLSNGNQFSLVFFLPIFALSHLHLNVESTPNTPKNGNQASSIANQLRPFLLEMIPEPLFEDSRKWNLQKKDKRGELKNEGRWLKLKIVGINLKEGLNFQIENLHKGPSRSTFTIQLSFDARIHLDRQTWKNGIRLYSGSTRARFRVFLKLDCELVSRTVKTDNWIPDLIIQLKVNQSHFRYDDLTVEHTAGLGGDFAKLLGELMIESLKLWKPKFEKDLIDKINSAIQKAGSSKEFSLKFSILL